MEKEKMSVETSFKEKLQEYKDFSDDLAACVARNEEINKHVKWEKINVNKKSKISSKVKNMFSYKPL